MIITHKIQKEKRDTLKGKYCFYIAVICLNIMCCTACGKKDILQKKIDPYQAVAVSAEEMQTGIYYVKNGTKFYQAYEPEGNMSSSNNVNPQKLFWVYNDISLIPTYYKGEIIAYASQDTELKGIQLERYKDLGYLLGLYGATFDSDGYLDFSVKKNTIERSDLGSVLSKAKSDSIRLATINDKPLSSDMVNRAGCVVGLPEKQQCTLGFYAGTYYQTATVYTDTKMLQFFEAYALDDVENTRNGYLKITMPDDAKSGYYYISGYGFFKYYDFQKGQGSEETADLNEAYYTSQKEQLAQYTQQYFAKIDTDTRDTVFTVTYDPQGYSDEDIFCIVTAPDDETVYDMEIADGSAKLVLDKAVAGRYTISIYPKELNVLDASVSSGIMGQDAMVKTETFQFDEDDTNLIFCADVIGNTNVWGTVTFEDGTAYEMSYNEESGRIEYVMPYVKHGKYEVAIYHYENTAIQNISYEKDTSSITEEIIHIEE